MNENINTVVALNRVSINVGKIKHPEFGEIFEGLKVDISLTDEAYSNECSTNLQALKFLAPIIDARIQSFVEKVFEREDNRRAERKASIENENRELLADFAIRMEVYNKQMEAFEEKKKAFEKKHAAWEKKVAQMKPEDARYESEPEFWTTEPCRPQRPHLHVL